MTNWLLKIGLVVTPFILAPSGTDIAREPKMAWALCFALAIGLTALYQGLLKPFRNKWTLVLAGFCLLSFYLSPNPTLNLFGIASGRFWSWEGLYQVLVFLIFTITVASLELSRKEANTIIDIMVWCGLAMGVLVVLQAMHLDQFFKHRFGTYGHMCGTLGNPTLVSPYLAMIAPLALYRRRYLFAGVIALATCLTRSDVALAGLVMGLVAYIALLGRKILIVVSILVVLLGGFGIYCYGNSPELRQKFPDNERFLTWTQSITDLKTPPMRDSKKAYAITGLGMGSFKYLFHVKNNPHNDNFLYAHNDYVQVAYELGIAGFFIFIAMILVMLRDRVWRQLIDHRRRALTASFISIATCAMGSFVFQIGTHIFYTLTIVGLLYNEGLNGNGKVQDI